MHHNTDRSHTRHAGSGPRHDAFRAHLRSREFTIGTFLKTPSSIVTEVVGLSDLDVVCFDAEHAPFGRLETDRCIAAARAADMPSLVRVAGHSPHDIRNALDSGATGVLVPHVCTAEQADQLVRASRFGEGGRGYAGSPRAAGYGTKPMAQHREDSVRQTTLIVQIEDIAALDHVEAIANTDVDALFIGRADLAVAMDKPVNDAAVIDTVAQICRTAAAAGKAVGMFTPRLDELPDWRAMGASLFLLGSDHGFLLQGANALANTARQSLKPSE